MSLDFLAGCVGGVAGVLVGHPLDTVRVNLQTQSVVNPKYKGTLHCLKSLMVKEGIRGIYRGASSPVAGVAGINAIMFGVYANVERNMADSKSIKAQVVAAGAAGLFSSFISCPMELAKSRIQVGGKMAGKNPIDCLIRMYKQDKIKGVYRGYGSTVVREVPGLISYFVTYEFLTKKPEGQIASTPEVLFAGGMAGVVSWVIPYPVDIIKSKIQVDGITSTKYNGYYDCFQKTIKTEGFRSLYRGLTPTVLRAFPVNAVTFCVVTWTIRFFDQRFAAFGNIEDMFVEYIRGVSLHKEEPAFC